MDSLSDLEAQGSWGEPSTTVIGTELPTTSIGLPLSAIEDATISIGKLSGGYFHKTLDQLIVEARSLGRLKIEDEYNGTTEVTIQFKRASGSLIYARYHGSKDSDLRLLLSKAIDEAKALQAV